MASLLIRTDYIGTMGSSYDHTVMPLYIVLCLFEFGSTQQPIACPFGASVGQLGSASRCWRLLWF